MTIWVLKCDIRKFFDSIDHDILLSILKAFISDLEIINLNQKVIKSFRVKNNKGLPLGNLTSQLYVNLYMNKFDQFVKHGLKVKNYIRYADDFIVLSKDGKYLERLLPKLSEFLKTDLKLMLHPKKCSIKTLASGVDFLGWKHFPYHRTLRTSTKKRIIKKIKTRDLSNSQRASYLGHISHENSYKIRKNLELT